MMPSDGRPASFLVLRHSGRGGSYCVAPSVWRSARDAALVVLLDRDGHRRVGDPRPLTAGRELIRSPTDARYLLEIDPTELATLESLLTGGGEISSRRDPDDPEYSEEDGWAEAMALPDRIEPQ